MISNVAVEFRRKYDDWVRVNCSHSSLDFVNCLDLPLNRKSPLVVSEWLAISVSSGVCGCQSKRWHNVLNEPSVWLREPSHDRICRQAQGNIYRSKSWVSYTNDWFIRMRRKSTGLHCSSWELLFTSLFFFRLIVVIVRLRLCFPHVQFDRSTVDAVQEQGSLGTHRTVLTPLCVSWINILSKWYAFRSCLRTGTFSNIGIAI